MLRERSQSLFFSLAFFDFIAAFGALALAMFVRFVLQEPDLAEFRELDLWMYAMVGVILALVQVTGFFSMGLYQLRRPTTAGHEVSRIVFAVTVNVLLVVAGLYFFRLEHVSRLTIVYYAIIDIFLVSARHAVIDRVLARLNRKRNNMRSVLVVGTGDAARRITDVFTHHRTLGFYVVGYVKADETMEIPEEWTLLGDFSDLAGIVEEHRPDMIVYTLNSYREKELRTLLDTCDQAGINLKIVPGFSSLVAAKGDVETLEGIPVISIREVPARVGLNRFIKRSFDVAFSALILILLSPFLLLTALLVKATSPGPVFYTQERMGLDNRSFEMLKFRTMRVQAKEDSDTIWTTRNDPRVTLIGSIMRKLSIDELPQFLNVLRGDMSVVGPRPERPYFVDKFKMEYHHYMRRHAVKAGITGWAQIKGLRGDTSIQERVEADIFYIENWTFWLDLKIILLTPFKGMINKNAY
ncbi:MAG: undecaprenyl-phosphate glucose phosphotransferase [Spirochaetaceae bacterium]|nr:MAG: undecaprenyl-phosphate glucose phosphotransferase [Spirochaetaceae bacterium]